MPDRTISDDTAYKVLSRIALYTVILAWIILGFYIFSTYESSSEKFLGYFLSIDRAGVKFRALILLAPFILTAIGYLINDRAKLFRNLSLQKKNYGNGPSNWKESMSF